MLSLHFTVENTYYVSECKNGTLFVLIPPKVPKMKKKNI